jgi:MFS transporter, DHA2 family, multidrug resistance protein
VLEEGNRNDWFESKAITLAAFVSAIGIAAFIIRELTAEVPAVNISLFKEPVFASGTLVGAVMFAMLLSLTFLLPVFMQELLGFTAVQAGLALMPRSLVMMVMMPIVGRVYNRISPRVCVGFGVLLFTWSAVLMSRYTLDTTSGDVVLVLAIQGVAFACLFIPLTTVALSAVPRHQVADATGLNSLLRQIGGSLGLAIFASLIPRINQYGAVALAAHVTPDRIQVTNRISMLTRAFELRGYDTVSAQTAAGRVLGGIVQQQASVMTFDRLFLLSGILFLIVLPLLIFLKSPDHAPNQAAPAEAAHIEL